ncbi:uncharacterized protein TrAFT101_004247 [Trichoderma asperellum]|nr:hypothetical protein TrAFT101_004247 [Trichoderma asperellum]
MLMPPFEIVASQPSPSHLCEIRCSVSPWRCFGRAPLGPHRVQALGPRPSPQSWAHPFDDQKPLALTYMKANVCRVRRCVVAAHSPAPPTSLLYPYYPPDGFHLKPCLATRTFPQPQHSTSRVSATLEPASHKLSEPSWNRQRLRYVRALLQPRDLRIELPIEGLIATNKRAAVQGSSSVLRPRPRLYCFSLHFTVHPPTVLFSRPRFPLSSGYLRFLIFPRVHHAPGRVVMNVNRHDPSTETPPVSSARIEFPVTSRTRHSR